MRRRRVTYRPSKAQGAMGAVFGGIFILIGLFVVIPTFGPFGILWTLAAVAITVMNGYQAFGKGYVGPEINIEEDTPQVESPSPTPPADLNAKERLEQLQALLDGGLITREEYDKKREEILSRL